MSFPIQKEQIYTMSIRNSLVFAVLVTQIVYLLPSVQCKSDRDILMVSDEGNAYDVGKEQTDGTLLSLKETHVPMLRSVEGQADNGNLGATSSDISSIKKGVAMQWVSLKEIAENPRQAFESWLFGRGGDAYKSNGEYEERFGVWMENLEYIVEYNREHDSHWLGLNRFADQRFEDWREGMSFGLLPNAVAVSEKNKNNARSQGVFRYENAEDIPESMDWREKKAVGEVKNQMMCGSCWAFSTTGAIEGINAITTGKLVSLSEQMLIDCDTSKDHGCHGGLMDFAFDFVVANGGIDTEESYPYKAEEGVCDVNRRDRHVVTIDGHEDVPMNDEVSLLKAVSNQPVSAAIEADQRAFQLYVGGVFDADCGTQLNHGVLVVGYGNEFNGTVDMPYWTIKNSWGPEWGDAGYIKIKRNTENVEGQCGVAMQASYPIKNGPNPPEPPPAPPAPPPEPPAPQPVDCDGTVACPPETTCCCMKDYFGFCFTWACCPLPEATCCEDKIHCCPKDLPVCELETGSCTKGPGYSSESVPLVEKISAQRKERGFWGPFRPTVAVV